MKSVIFLLLCLGLQTSYAQPVKAKAIELTVLGRYDYHADYTSRYGSRSYTNQTSLAGVSYSWKMAYQHPLNKSSNIKAGIGYYQLGINEIRQSTPFGTVKGRNFEDLSTYLAILYSTDNYHYNTIPLSVSINHYLPLSNRISLMAEAEFQYLFTYAQNYHHFGNKKIYRTSNVGVLGYGLNAYIGLRKKYNNFYIQPQFILPVYQSLKGDRVFKEDESLRMNKWLKGTGIALSFGRYF